MSKKVLITGISGQVGSYLAEIGLERGYEIHGIIRRSSSFNTGRIDHIYDKLKLYYGDLTDSLSIDEIVHKVKPDYLFSMAAQSHVAVSYVLPLYTGSVDALGNLIVLEAIKKHAPNCRFLQASTSELFGKVLEIPQSEKTPFNVQSPYACAKLYAYHMTKIYRESYNLFTSNSICFNTESPRRGETFVTKKITNGVKKWLKTGQPEYMGNLNTLRDWGYAPEYAECMYKIIEHSEPDDFVLATGESHSNREFIEETLKYLPNYTPDDFEWIDSGVNEKLIEKHTGKVVIAVSEKYFRPSEVDILQGDATKAKKILGWEPKVKFHELVKIMMENDLKMNS